MQTEKFLQKHYIAIFRCENRWFIYDDTGAAVKHKKTRYIDSYAEDYEEMLLKSDGMVPTRATMHFYVREDKLL